MALNEETVYDPKTGLPAIRNLADYHVPTNSDIPDIDVHFLGEPDFAFNPIGARGMGEIRITGMANIGAVILAAGESKRLGQSKQLLQFRGKSLIRAVVDSAVAANCSPIIVVLGTDQPANESIGNELRETTAKIIFNPDWRRGIGTSIRAGVDEVASDDEISAVLLLTCDQPFVDAALLDHLAAAQARSKKQIVASSYAGTLGIPALFARACFEELSQLGDDEGAKKIIHRDPSRMKLVLFPAGAVNIDTPADFRNLSELDRPARTQD